MLGFPKGLVGIQLALGLEMCFSLRISARGLSDVVLMKERENWSGY